MGILVHIFMIPSPVICRASFSKVLFRFCPRKSTANLQKYLSGTSVGINSAAFSSTSTSPDFDDFPEEDGADFPYPEKKRRISANHQTYIWLLDGYLKSKSIRDVQKIFASILKSGYDEDHAICSRLIDAFIACGNLEDALQVFDNMPRNFVSSWNKLICALVSKNSVMEALGFFSQMMAENVKPDENVFANVLRACGGGKIDFHYVQQIHAKIVHYGFSKNHIVCNPLIDLYSKNGYIDVAKRVFGGLVFRDNVSWVAMISGLSQNKLEKEGIELFLDMHKSGVTPTPYIFSSVLSACTKIELFGLGKQLHSLIYKWGFSSETFVCNALVSLYSRSGQLISAEQIFSKMNRRDEVSYNSLIKGLAQCGFSEEALKLFDKMQTDSLKPDCVTIASLLSACASVNALDKGRQLHSYALKAGIISDFMIEGSLLDLYVKCSDVETANDFFLATQTQNVVLWNVMLVAYGQIGNLDESYRIFSEMQLEGLSPNQYTYPSILRTCTFVGALELGEQIHSQVIKTGFQPNVYVCSVLIDMYAKHGKLDVAMKILKRLNEKDVVSWTAMIAGYTQHDMFIEAIKLFEEMQARGIQSDNIGFASAISACAGIQALNQGRQIHSQSTVNGHSHDLSIGNALISLYARCGKILEANLAFDKIDRKDNISWNGLISGFAQSGLCENSLQVFAEMHRRGIEVNMFTFSSAVSAAANTANIKQGRQIHACIMKKGFNAEPEASNVLITLYSKCGSLDDARQEFLEMRDKNEVSWNAMITGYSQHGRGDVAINLFEEMKGTGSNPTHVTFVGVLTACSHVGLVEKGLEYFNSMSREYRLKPKPEHYACVVDILGRAGHLNRARDFILTMPIEPDAMVWRTLLSACTVHKNAEIGQLAARQLLELEPEDSATYVLLSNMYAVAGKWVDRDKTRQLMKERGVKKEPGKSWIEVKNSIHAFFVGDKLHPLADKIYEFLEDLNERVARIGYVQDRYVLLNSAEQDQKDPSTYIHSEKLAISFGLISLSSAIPLRVIKNLRVCNDCHNWIKLVSKVSNRSIVVRDSYRFHHFENGVCSCNDYW